MKFAVLWLVAVFPLSRGQHYNGNNNGLIRPSKGPLHHSSSPCYDAAADQFYDSVSEERSGKTLILAAVGGGAVGYHLGMKAQKQPIINNNIYNEYPPSCIFSQSGGGGAGILGNGGLVGGFLGNHPILSNIIQGGFPGGGNFGANNRQNNVNWNRAIRQFTRVIRPIARGLR